MFDLVSNLLKWLGSTADDQIWRTAPDLPPPSTASGTDEPLEEESPDCGAIIHPNG